MPVLPTEARFDEDTMWVALAHGRTLGVPLAWFPRLLAATPKARAAVTLTPFGLHWETLDEDISAPRSWPRKFVLWSINTYVSVRPVWGGKPHWTFSRDTNASATLIG